MADIRIKDLPLDASPVASDVVAIDNATTRSATVQSIVEIGRPVASQAQAEAGVNNTLVMTPLTTKQAVTFYGLTKSVYDPTNVNADAFALANMTGQVSSAQIAPDAVTQTAMANNSVGTNELINDNVTNAKLANMATGTVKARVTAGTGDPEDVPTATFLSSLNVVSYDAQTPSGAEQTQARANIGAVIGSDVQAYDADLTALGGLSKTVGAFIVGNGTTWVIETGATARASMGAQGNLARVTVRTASATHTTLANCSRMVVELVGGGGGGGGAASTSSIPRAGAGGAGGGYAIHEITSPAASYALVIGSLGNPGGPGGADGSSGGNTTFDGVSAAGGSGGPGSGTTNNADQQSMPGGTGNLGSGGKLNIRGQSGDGGLKLSTTCRYSGGGGNSMYGAGGVGRTGNSAGFAQDGVDATGYGGGGGGGSGSNAGGSSGGQGSAGVAIIWEYI